MMMYQILCGHVNYALGKTRMQAKKNKNTLYFGFMFILISWKFLNHIVNSILSIFHIITVHLLIIITTNIVIRLLKKNLWCYHCVWHIIWWQFFICTPLFLNITMLWINTTQNAKRHICVAFSRRNMYMPICSTVQLYIDS